MPELGQFRIEPDSECDTLMVGCSRKSLHSTAQVNRETSISQRGVRGGEGEREVANVGQSDTLGDNQTVNHIAKIQMILGQSCPTERELLLVLGTAYTSIIPL